MKRACFLKVLAIVMLLFLLPVIPLSFASERRQNGKDKVVMIVVNHITWDDISQAKTPFLDSLLRRSAIGLLSPRTVGVRSTTGRGYLTVGASNRAEDTPTVGQAFNASEPVEEGKAIEVFSRRLGKSSQAEVVHLGIASLIRRNADLPYGATPGMLGRELKKHQLATAVLGNADTSFGRQDKTYHREITTIAMNEQGEVDHGDVSKKLLIKDGSSPFGIRTNQGMLLRRFKEVEKKADFIVVDFGDTSRVDSHVHFATEKAVLEQRKRAIEQADSFIEKVYSSVDLSRTLFMIVSPSPPTVIDGRQQLTPIIMVGKGVRPGLLTSGSTLRPSLVSNVDIAPTVLNFFGYDSPSEFTGREISYLRTETKNQIFKFITFNKRTVLRDWLEPIMVIFFIVFQIIVFLIVLIMMLTKKFFSRSTYILFSNLVLCVIAIPATFFLITHLVPPEASFFWAFGVEIGLIIALVVVALFMGEIGGKKFSPIFFICVLTGILIVGDMFLGAKLHLNSIFGYSPIIAGRFYGLGNQGLAILVSVALLGSTLFLEQVGKSTTTYKILIGVLFAFLAFVIGFPRLGANTGGIITAVAAFGATYLQLIKREIRLKEVLIIFLIAVLILASFVLFDFLQASDAETHMGHSAQLITRGGLKTLFQIVERKTAANLRILKVSSWSYLLVAILILLTFLRLKPIGEFEKLLSKYPYLACGITGALVGGIVGFCTNDSGIVIPALIASFFTSAVFYLILREELT